MFINDFENMNSWIQQCLFNKISLLYIYFLCFLKNVYIAKLCDKFYLSPYHKTHDNVMKLAVFKLALNSIVLKHFSCFLFQRNVQEWGIYYILTSPKKHQIFKLIKKYCTKICEYGYPLILNFWFLWRIPVLGLNPFSGKPISLLKWRN